MASAARASHAIGVTGTLSSASSTAQATSAQNDSSFFENSNQRVRPSFFIFSKTKDLCQNASLAVSTFVGSPMRRALQRPVNVHEIRSSLWISAQSVSKGSSENSVVIKSTNSTTAVADEVAISAASETPAKTSKLFSHISDLIKLVNSRDIVEFHLKHTNYELLLRKKEALPSPPPPPPPAPPLPHFFPGPHVMAHTPFPTLPHEAPTAPAPPPVAAPVEEIAAPKQDFPAMLSPMAGTFYRNPGPGEPPFVKVGDKVQKGQVVCIVEAMKLMNEIEADQSGTITEILAEDGKVVSIDTPLFIIKP